MAGPRLNPAARRVRRRAARVTQRLRPAVPVPRSRGQNVSGRTRPSDADPPSSLATGLHTCGAPASRIAPQASHTRSSQQASSPPTSVTPSACRGASEEQQDPGSARPLDPGGVVGFSSRQRVPTAATLHESAARPRTTRTRNRSHCSRGRRGARRRDTRSPRPVGRALRHESWCSRGGRRAASCHAVTRSQPIKVSQRSRWLSPVQHRLVQDRADGAQRQCRAGQHAGRADLSSRPEARCEERGRHRRCRSGPAWRTRTPDCGPVRWSWARQRGRSGRGRTRPSRNPAAMTASGTTGTIPSPGGPTTRPNPSTSRPAPSKKNETRHDHAVRAVGVLTEAITHRAEVGDRSKWRSTKPAALDRSRAIATGRSRALRAPPGAARSLRSPDRPRAGTDADRRSGCAARTAAATTRR